MNKKHQRQLIDDERREIIAQLARYMAFNAYDKTPNPQNAYPLDFGTVALDVKLPAKMRETHFRDTQAPRSADVIYWRLGKRKTVPPLQNAQGYRCTPVMPEGYASDPHEAYKWYDHLNRNSYDDAIAPVLGTGRYTHNFVMNVGEYGDRARIAVIDISTRMQAEAAPKPLREKTEQFITFLCDTDGMPFSVEKLRTLRESLMHTPAWKQAQEQHAKWSGMAKR